MFTNATRRSLLAMAGVTTGVASLAVAPAVASAEAVPAQPDATAQDAGTASHGTCFGRTAFRDIAGGRGITLPTTSTNSGNTHCIMSQGLGVGNPSGPVFTLQLSIWECYQGLRGVLGTVDGQYGPRTRDAVIFVQALEGAAQDGVYGPETKSKMRWRTIAPGPCSRIG